MFIVTEGESSDLWSVETTGLVTSRIVRRSVLAGEALWASLWELRHSRHAGLLWVSITSGCWCLAELRVLWLRISLTLLSVWALRVLWVSWWCTVPTKVAALRWCLWVTVVLRWSSTVRVWWLAWILLRTFVHVALVGLECACHCIKEVVLGILVPVLSVLGLSDDLRAVDFSGHAGILNGVLHSVCLSKQDLIVALNIVNSRSGILRSGKNYKEEVDSDQDVVSSTVSDLRILGIKLLSDFLALVERVHDLTDLFFEAQSK